MAVAKKPSRQKKETPASLDNIIDKGGSSAKSKNREEEIKNVQLRIPQSTLNEIDKVLNNKSPKPKRHYWLLEAVYQKLELEQANQ
jgi:hypothetical protein